MKHFKLLVLFSLLFFSSCGYGNRYLASKILFVGGEEFNITPQEVGLEYVEVNFKNTDGNNLHGWMIPGKEGNALIVYLHGNMSNVTHGLEKIKLLHELGFSVLTFEYRGYGKSQGQPIFEDDFYRDARAALLWLERHGWEVSQMIYYGHSMGAAVAIELAVEKPPSGIILESAFTSYADMFKLQAPILYMFGGWTLREFNNISKMAKLKGPLIVIHGEADDIVPSWMSNELYAKASEPKKIILVPSANHINSMTVGAKKVKQALTSFFIAKKNRLKD